VPEFMQVASGVHVGVSASSSENRWIDRHCFIEFVWGNTAAGKSGSTVAKIYRFLRDNNWVRVAYSPIFLADGDPFQGPPTNPRRIFDNSDGHIPGYAKCKVVLVDSWPRLFRDLVLGKIKDCVLFLDEISLLARNRDWKSQLNELIGRIGQWSARFNVKIFATEQRKRNFDVNLRAITFAVSHPLRGPGNVWITKYNREDEITLMPDAVDLENWPAEGGALNSRQAEREDSRFSDEAERLGLTWGRIWDYYNRGERPNYEVLTLSLDDVSAIMEGDDANQGMMDFFFSGEHPFLGKIVSEERFNVSEGFEIADYFLKREKWFLSSEQTRFLAFNLLTRWEQKRVREKQFETLLGFCANDHMRRFRRGLPPPPLQCTVPGCRLRVTRLARKVYTEEGKIEIREQELPKRYGLKRRRRSQ